MRSLLLLFIVQTASLVFAQETEKTFRLANVRTSQDAQEVTTVVRAIGDIRDLTVNAEQRTFTMRGTAVQLALAEWLVTELDGAPRQSGTREHRMPGETEGTVRVFYVSENKTVAELQEIATLIRATSEVKRLFTYNMPRAVVVRGTDEQIKLADWLVTEVDGGPNRSTGPREYRVRGTTEGVVRVFYVADARSVQQLQEAATMIRALVEIRRMFTYNTTGAMVVRGTEEQVKLAEWMLPDIKVPVNGGAVPRAYRIQGDSAGEVRMFHLNPEVSIRDLQEVATMVRSMSDIRRLFTYGASRTIAARGTGEEIQLATWLVNELNTNAARGASGEFRIPNGDLVRVFYLPGVETAQRLQEIATEVRTTTGVRRLFTYNAPRAMAVRGTPEQIATAGAMVKDFNR